MLKVNKNKQTNKSMEIGSNIFIVILGKQNLANALEFSFENVNKWRNYVYWLDYKVIKSGCEYLNVLHGF